MCRTVPLSVPLESFSNHGGFFGGSIPTFQQLLINSDEGRDSDGWTPVIYFVGHL